MVMADRNGVERTYANKDEYDFEGGEVDEMGIDFEKEMDGSVKDLSEKNEISLDDFANNLKTFVVDYKPVENSFKQIFGGTR